MDHAAIAREVASLGDWITGFEIGGVRYGGAYMPTGDERFTRFVTAVQGRLPASPRILECGCLEGAHTTMLSQAFPQARIDAVDIRESSLRKARYLTGLQGCTNIDFFEDDFDEPRRWVANSYDAIFCVGLLYHLRWPQRFLKAAAKASPILWLWTVYCTEEEAVVREDALRGRFIQEDTSHPLSSVRAESFFPTLGSLAALLWDAGFTNIDLVKRETTANGNGPAITLCASR